MKFLHLFHKEVEFGNIEGYDDIKDIVRRALNSEENYNLLLCDHCTHKGHHIREYLFYTHVS
jgi:hypothetical protein